MYSEHILKNLNLIPQKSRHRLGCGMLNVAALPLNCKITEKLVSIDSRFKSCRIPTTPQKQSRGNLKRYFD